MAQFLGFGDGSDGAATLSGTDAPIDSSCSGTSGSTSLSATNGSFAAGQIILIHQSRGSTAGNWEINQIGAYSAGTITTSLPLANTYTDSGADQAQVLVLKQYTSVTVSGTFSAKAWDGNVGGILGFLASGKVTVTGKIEAGDLGAGEGYSTVNQGFMGATTQGGQGEGTVGTRNSVNGAANGSGGGGGAGAQGGGAGGGNATAGTNGAVGSGTAGGTGGLSSGSSDLTTMTFGGGGGRGGAASGEGGYGGGIIIIYADQIDCSAGTIEAQGSDGQVGASPGAGGGGGAGGSIFIKTKNGTIGTNKIIAKGGNGGAGGGGGAGGAGSDGRIRIEACSLSGSSNPSASEQLGGHSFCTVKHGIL